MPEPRDLTPLLAVLRDLVAWLEYGKVPGVVIGGLAASLLGRPRLTRDVEARSGPEISIYMSLLQKSFLS